MKTKLANGKVQLEKKVTFVFFLLSLNQLTYTHHKSN